MAHKADSVVSPKASVPKVALSATYRCRVRGIDYALKGCVNGTDEKGNAVEYSWSLQPNTWTPVKKEVYEFLKTKFDHEREYDVPDWEPGGEGSRAVRTPRKDTVQAYIIEFKE